MQEADVPLYWGVDGLSIRPSGISATNAMVELRIKPYKQQADEQARRAEQSRIFRRNQAFGLLLVAAAIVIWRLFHTSPEWIFPSGWWRP